MNQRKNSKAKKLEKSFFDSVLNYIKLEYKVEYTQLILYSSIKSQIYNLISEYYWGGNTVQFVAGQIVDLLESKYNKRS